MLDSTMTILLLSFCITQIMITGDPLWISASINKI